MAQRRFFGDEPKAEECAAAPGGGRTAKATSRVSQWSYWARESSLWRLEAGSQIGSVPRDARRECVECGTHTVRATSSRSEAGRRRIATAASLNTRTPVRILVIMTLFLRITLRIEFVLRLRVDDCVLIARDVHTGQNCNDHVNAHADRLLIITVILRQLSAASTSTPSNAHVCAEMRDRKRERDSSTSRRCRGKGVNRSCCTIGSVRRVRIAARRSHAALHAHWLA